MRRSSGEADSPVVREHETIVRHRGAGLEQLAEELGTPLLVLDADRLRLQARRFKVAFSAWPRLELFFSYKTCPLVAVMRIFKEEGYGAEVVSPGELDGAFRAGVTPGAMTYDGRVRPGASLGEAVARGVGLINVETEADLAPLARAMAGKGPVDRGERPHPPRIGIRLRIPNGPGAVLGRRAEERAARRLAERALASGLAISAIHIHPGYNLRTARPYVESIRRAMRMAEWLARRGQTVELLDLGGGFGVPGVYPYGLADRALGKLGVGFTRLPSTVEPRPLEEVARRIAGCLAGQAGRRGLDLPVLALEPGRFLVSAAGTLLVRVEGVRSASAPPELVLETGPLSGAQPLAFEHHAIEPLVPRPGKVVACRLSGPVPAEMDRVPVPVRMPLPRVGDLLAVRDAGAYFISFGRWQGQAAPKVVLLAGDAG